ncbi:MAG: hypothetical protein K0V04_08845 [Deltaproteobacteria bacterium]|nr:hypothetical protein [Deltaproteobacteria bacterium]
MSRRSLVVALPLLVPLVSGCSGDPYAQAPPPAVAAKATPAATPPPSADGKTPAGGGAAAKPTGPRKGVLTKHDDGKPVAKVLPTAPLPLVKMLGEPPPTVESFLGPVVAGSKGGMRDSCVRYIPNRTWFRCKFAWQRYTDKTNNFKVVHVTYEDGKATGLAFEGIPGAGEFDYTQALRKVGLELPGEPKLDDSQSDAKVWSWFNSTARLMIHDRQYRVRVSSVEGGWDRAKVELILNDALNDSEKSRMFVPEEGASPDADAPG